mmetsp:Transcript_5753/g.17711  ORF Transcript_5753/g.17711 Transcript_5753/m.17711 type:complete len:256 (+) Transcript_5753:287-1054(+)
MISSCWLRTVVASGAQCTARWIAGAHDVRSPAASPEVMETMLAITSTMTRGMAVGITGPERLITLRSRSPISSAGAGAMRLGTWTQMTKITLSLMDTMSTRTTSQRWTWMANTLLSQTASRPSHSSRGNQRPQILKAARASSPIAHLNPLGLQRRWLQHSARSELARHPMCKRLGTRRYSVKVILSWLTRQGRAKRSPTSRLWCRLCGKRNARTDAPKAQWSEHSFWCQQRSSHNRCCVLRVLYQWAELLSALPL